jgi:hypothetical protein
VDITLTVLMQNMLRKSVHSDKYPDHDPLNMLGHLGEYGTLSFLEILCMEADPVETIA